MLTSDQFAARAVGLPWVRWRSDWDSCDCYGLVILYFREVLGIELGNVPHTDIVAGFFSMDCWRECDAEPGATVWMAWRDGSPTHVGILLDGDSVIHAEGSPDAGGSVRVTRLPVMSRIYGESKFLRYSPC